MRESFCKRCSAPLPEPGMQFCTSDCERDYREYGGWQDRRHQ